LDTQSYLCEYHYHFRFHHYHFSTSRFKNISLSYILNIHIRYSDTSSDPICTGIPLYVAYPQQIIIFCHSFTTLRGQDRSALGFAHADELARAFGERAVAAAELVTYQTLLFSISNSVSLRCKEGGGVVVTFRIHRVCKKFPGNLQSLHAYLKLQNLLLPKVIIMFWFVF